MELKKTKRGLLLLICTGALLSGAIASSDDFSFVFVGDTHYDKLTHHDMDWVNRFYPDDIRQIENYTDGTANLLPALFEEMKTTVSNAPAPVRYCISGGDFVEGLCGSYTLQALQFKEFIDFVESMKFGVPFVMAKGNHDITPRDVAKYGYTAEAAYNDIILPYLSGQLGREVTSAHYNFVHRNAHFIFYDNYNADIDGLEAVLKGSESEHKIVVMHQPLVPFDGKAHMYYLYRDEQAADRARLKDLLGTHHAILLCGHSHRYSFLSRDAGGGRFVQLEINSVINDRAQRPKDFITGTENYTWSDEDQPHVNHFEFARFGGYALIRINGSSVTADIYSGAKGCLWRSIDLSGPLHEGDVK